METRIIKVSGPGKIYGQFENAAGVERLHEWSVHGVAEDVIGPLRAAGEYLRTNDTPVAFPTETVYGLGADATRSTSVKGIFSAKGRPSDNPLIVHVSDLQMLRALLQNTTPDEDPIPTIYKTLIEKFWPGPLTILLPNAQPSKLAPEVTAGLSTFGARMPSSTLALSLIKLAGVPLAAPSANASTKPSPTAAHHVKHDLNGRIELILDGGPCQVGVESTVVDGLCEPPVILRPGGISLEEIQSCPGWENVAQAYKDQSEVGKAAPRAPGMKYKHYSPKARVILYEDSFSLGRTGLTAEDLTETLNTSRADCKQVGIIRTRIWKAGAGLQMVAKEAVNGTSEVNGHKSIQNALYEVTTAELRSKSGTTTSRVIDVNLGSDIRKIAQGLFSALRDLDSLGVDVIFVEGIDDKIDIAAAVMNRLRKAASEIRS